MLNMLSSLCNASIHAACGQSLLQHFDRQCSIGIVAISFETVALRCARDSKALPIILSFKYPHKKKSHALKSGL